MKHALLLIDLQNDYFPNGKMVLANSVKAGQSAQQLLHDFRKNKKLIVHIQHIATRSDATFFLPDTYGVEINQLVKPNVGEKIILKHYPNSFQETQLLDYLKKNHIEKITVAGMMTHMCVDSTVRAAKDFGFDIEVIANACATKDLEIKGRITKAEDVQNAFLSAMSYYFSKVINTEDFFLANK